MTNYLLDKRFASLPYAERKRVMLGETTLDDYDFWDIDANAAEYEKMQREQYPERYREYDEQVRKQNQKEAGFFDMLGPSLRQFETSATITTPAGLLLGSGQLWETAKDITEYTPSGALVGSVLERTGLDEKIKKEVIPDLERRGAELLTSGAPEIMKEIEEVQSLLDSVDDSTMSGKTKKFLMEALGGAAQNIDNILPLISGVGTAAITRNPVAAAAATKATAVIPATRAYAQAYLQAKSNGWTDEDANKWALGQSGLEYFFESIAPGAGKTVLGTMAKRTGGEVISEAGTQALQDLSAHAFMPEEASTSSLEAARSIGLAGTSAAMFGGPISTVGAGHVTKLRNLKDMYEAQEKAKKEQEERNFANAFQLELGDLAEADPAFREAYILAQEQEQREREKVEAIVGQKIQAESLALQEKKSKEEETLFEKAKKEREADALKQESLVDEDRAKREIEALYKAREEAEQKTRESELEFGFDQIKEQALLDSVDKAYKTNDPLIIAKAEKELDDFYKTSPPSKPEKVEVTPDIKPRDVEAKEKQKAISDLQTEIKTFNDLLPKTQGRRAKTVLRNKIAESQKRLDELTGATTPPPATTPQTPPLGSTVEAPTQPQQGVPVMITRSMKRQLKGLGYTPEQVAKMTPQVAWNTIRAKSPPPPETAETPEGVKTPEGVETQAGVETPKPTETPVDETPEVTVEDVRKQKNLLDRKQSVRRALVGELSPEAVSNIEVVAEDTDNVPEGFDINSDQQGAYDPTTGKLYINARVVDEGNAVAVALHEIAHPYNEGGIKTGRASINRLVGKNQDTLVSRVDEMANSGLKVAQRALDRSKKQDGTLDKSEVLSYFVEEASIERANARLPRKAQLFLKDIVAAVKQNLIDTFGDKLPFTGRITEADIFRAAKMMVRDFKKPEKISGKLKASTKVQTDEMTAPSTEADTKSAIGGVDNTQDLYDEISKGWESTLDAVVQNAPSDHAREIAKTITDRLRQLQSIGFEFSISVTDEGKMLSNGARGVSILKPSPLGSSTKVEIILNHPSNGDNAGTNWETTTHELAHAATQAAVKHSPKGSAAAKLRELFNDVIKEFNRRAKSGSMTPFEKKVYNRQTNALQNPDELLAWGLTNAEAQEWLASVTVEKRSLFDRLLDVVSSALGLKKDQVTAMSELIALSDEILTGSVDQYIAEANRSGESFGRQENKSDIPSWVLLNANGRPILYHDQDSALIEAVSMSGKKLILVSSPAGTSRVDIDNFAGNILPAAKMEELRKIASGLRGDRRAEQVMLSRRPAQPTREKKARKIAADVKQATQSPDIETATLGGIKRQSPGSGPNLKPVPTRGVSKHLRKLREFVGSSLSTTRHQDPLYFEEAKSLKGETAEGVIEAIQVFRRLLYNSEKAAMKAAKTRRRKGAVYNQKINEIRSLLEKATSMDVVDARTARSDLKDKYPDVYNEFIDARMSIDSLSLSMMDYLLRNKGKLTEKEVKNIRAIANNLDFYITRQYKANMSKDIREQQFNIVMEGYKRFKDLPDKANATSEERIFEDLKNYIRDHFLSITDIQEIDALSEEAKKIDTRMKPFQEMYARWVDPAKVERNILPVNPTEEQKDKFINQAIKDLQEKKAELERAGVYVKKLEEKAQTYALDFMNKIKEGRHNDLLMTITGVDAESGILQKKGKVPDQIRRALGEITDPLIKIHNTMYELNKELARQRFISNIYEGYKDVLWIDEVDVTPENVNQFTTILSGNRFGALEGKRVRKDIAESFDQLTKMENSYESILKAIRLGDNDTINKIILSGAAKVIGKGNRGWKLINIVYNGYAAVADFLSTFSSILSEGYIPYANKEARDFAFGAAYYLINAGDRRTFPPAAKEAMRRHLFDSGLIGDIQEADIQRLGEAFLDEYIAKGKDSNFIDTTGKKMKEVLGRRLSQAGRIVGETKAMSDVVGKLYVYHMEKQHLRKLEEARKQDNPNHTPMTEDQIEKEASRLTDQTNIGYHRVPPILAPLEQVGAAFLVNFTWENFRITLNRPKEVVRLMLRYNELDKSKEKTLVGKRLAARAAGLFSNFLFNEGLVFATTRLAPILYAGYLLAEGGEEEEKENPAQGMIDEAEMRELVISSLPARDRSKSWLIEIDPKSKQIFMLDGSRIVTNEIAAALLVDALAGMASDERFDRFKGQLKNVIGVSPIYDLVRGKSKMEKQNPELFQKVIQMTGSEENARIAARLFEQGTPATLSNLTQLLEESSALSQSSFATKALALAGARPRVINPEFHISSIAWDYKDSKNEARDKLRDLMYNNSTTDSEFESEYIKALSERIEQSRIIFRNIELARKLGYDENQIDDFLKKADLNEDERFNFKQGEVDYRILSAKDIVAYVSKVSEEQGVERGKSISDKYGPLIKKIHAGLSAEREREKQR